MASLPDDDGTYSGMIKSNEEILREAGVEVGEINDVETYDMAKSSDRKDLAQDLNRVASALVPFTMKTEEAIDEANRYINEELPEQAEAQDVELSLAGIQLSAKGRAKAVGQEIAQEYGAEVFNDLLDQRRVSEQDIINSFAEIVEEESEVSRYKGPLDPTYIETVMSDRDKSHHLEDSDYEFLD